MLQKILHIFGPIVYKRQLIKTAAKVWTYVYMLVDSLTIDQLTDIFY